LIRAEFSAAKMRAERLLVCDPRHEWQVIWRGDLNSYRQNHA
jgi:hypothetical protein